MHTKRDDFHRKLAKKTNIHKLSRGKKKGSNPNKNTPGVKDEREKLQVIIDYSREKGIMRMGRSISETLF